MPHRARLACAIFLLVGVFTNAAVSRAAETMPALRKPGTPISDADRQFWSFRPVSNPPVPTAQDGGWCRNPIDRFIFATLAQRKLSPAPEADRATLIRRATFELHGVPPTPAEADAFVADQSPDAYEKLIDRLLASPRYGERWARQWLDLVRYAESDGFKQDAYRPAAWPYRDYVIRSINNDKPYDRFVAEQVAGDEIAPDDPDVIVATGFLRHTPYEYNQRDVPRQWAEMLNDVTDVTGDALLGLSVGCARCHDHKFDPISREDYYRLQAFFTPMLPRDDIPLATASERAAAATKMLPWEQKTAKIRAELQTIELPYVRKTADVALGKFPVETQAILFTPADRRTPFETQIAALANRQVYDPDENPPIQIDAKKDPQLKARHDQLRQQLAEFKSEKPTPLQRGQTVTDVGPAAPPTYIPGDSAHVIEPGAPRVFESTAEPPTPGLRYAEDRDSSTDHEIPVFASTLRRGRPGESSLRLPEIHVSSTSTGRRTALAKWITDPHNPLTARVMVNRIWQGHFGRGIVATSSDFGRLGERPSHPELLDWLAAQFVQNGWHIKTIHRLIMTSATYRQASVGVESTGARRIDPDDRLLWRMTTRRLDAEQIRDAMLASTGELNESNGGPPVDPNVNVRSVYLKVLRNQRDRVLDAFDAPESFCSVATRNCTTTASQSLLLLNGDWPLKRAAAFAARVKREANRTDAASLVQCAYRIAFGRVPNSNERTKASDFLANSPAGVDAALTDLCHVILSSNEFLYVD